MARIWTRTAPVRMGSLASTDAVRRAPSGHHACGTALTTAERRIFCFPAAGLSAPTAANHSGMSCFHVCQCSSAKGSWPIFQRAAGGHDLLDRSTIGFWILAS